MLIQISRLRQTNFVILFFFGFLFFSLALKTDTLQFKETFRYVLNFKHINTPNEVVLLTIQKSHN